MSKARVVVSDISGEESSSAPYSTRREKSRKLAQKRRDTYKQIMDDLTSVLPFPKEAVSQLDYNSRLRLALCFFRLKTMVDSSGEVTGDDVQTSPDSGKQIVRKKLVSDAKPAMFQPGMLQDLMNEALDGFLMVTQVDGTIVFLSESIHKHLGLFQSEHIGVNMFELIHEEDHSEVRSKISDAEIKSLNQKGSSKVTFFCRLKCSRYKVANVITKSPGYKLVYISGTIKRARGEPFIACVVRPVSPPSVLEIRLEGNMFVCRYAVDFTCTYFDGRLFSLLGYEKDDLIGKKPFDLFHHDDIEAIVKCRNKVFEKGESLSGYYRFFNAYGQSIWLQTRATLIIDSRTGKPVCVNCMFFVISKEQGDRDFQARLAIKSSESSIKDENIHSHDPFPVVERSDGTVVNPLQDDRAPSYEVTPSTSDSPSSSSVEIENTPSTSSSYSSPGDSEFPSSSSPSGISNSRGGQSGSRSSLQSESPVDSGTGNEISQSYAHHGSSSSINSRGTSSGGSVFTGGSPRQEPISSTGVHPQSISPDHRVDNCLPDSTTSSHSTPYGDQPNGLDGVTVLNHTSSSDLGYRSGSSGSLSLRDRLTSSASYRSSPMKRTDSNTSSNISDVSASCGAVHSSGVAASLPLHASTPAGMTSMSSPEMHSQSPFHGVNGNTIASTGVSMSDAPPTYQPQPVDQYGDIQSYGSMHNQSVTSNGGFTIPMNSTSQKFGGSAAGLNISMVQMNVGLNGGPQQFLPQSNIHVPVNGAPGMDLADSLPDWIPDPTTASSGGVAHQGINGEPVLNLQSTAGPGFEFISTSLVGDEEIYNPPPIISAAPNMFVDSSVSGQSSNFSTSFQAPLRDSSVTCNGTNVATASDLPQLTGEDLKILDAFDHIQGGVDQLGPFVYQQTPLNYNMTM